MDLLAYASPLIAVAGLLWRLLRELQRHTADHELLARELAPNGGEGQLAPEDQTLNLRKLVIRTRATQLHELEELGKIRHWQQLHEERAGERFAELKDRNQ